MSKTGPDEELSAELFKPENLSCPHAMWAKIRQECPVPQVALPGPKEGVFLISRKEDLEFAGKHPEIFSSEVGAEVWRWGGKLGPELDPIIEDGGYELVHTIVSSDPPRAFRFRKIALEALSPARVRARASDVQAIIDTLLAKIPENEEVDFRARFAVPLPIHVLMAVFGIDKDREEFVYRFSSALLSLVDPITPIEQAKKDLQEVVAAQKFLASLIEQYRKEPADNFLSFIANARDEDADNELLSMEEALSMAFITLAGGSETIRNAIATAAFELAHRRPLWEELRDDPDKIDAFVEEVVRFGSPATITARQVAQDTELGGTSLPKGAAAFMLWGSGSHDEAFFEKPEEFRLDRPEGRRHTSFGAGVHHCAGIHLARAELGLSVRSWLDTFESMELAVPESEIRYDPVFAIRALSALPLIFKRRKP